MNYMEPFYVFLVQLVQTFQTSPCLLQLLMQHCEAPEMFCGLQNVT